MAGDLVDLTEHEKSVVLWCANINPDGIGFLGPTVLKHGPVDEYRSAVDKGLVQCFDRSSPPRNRAAYGYWLTPLGKEAASDLRRLAQVVASIKPLVEG